MRRELSAKHDATIDVLRVLALSSVLVAHLYDEQRDFVYYTLLDGNRLFFPLWAFFSTGGGGVALFFMMSGYLVTRSSLNKSSTLFLKQRIIRIYPTYLLAILACKILTDNGPESISDWIGSITLLGDFWSVPPQLGGVSWTLNLEVYFFSLTAIVLLVGRREFIRRLSSDRICLILLIPVLTLAVLPLFPTRSMGSVSIYATLFMPGIAMCLYDKKIIDVRHLLLLSICSVAGTFYNTFRLYSMQLQLGNSKFVVADQSHEGIAFATYILGALAVFLIMFSQRGKISDIKLIRWLAEHSYQLYLYHFFLVGWLVPKFESFLLNVGVRRMHWNHVVAELSAILILVLTVSFTSKYIEKPVMRLGKNLGR